MLVPALRVPLAIGRYLNTPAIGHIKWIHCVGCGSNLVTPFSRKNVLATQFQDVNQGVQARFNEKTDSIVTSMSPEQLDALGWNPVEQIGVDKHELRRSTQAIRASKATKSLLCKSCIMTREGTISPLELPTPHHRVNGRVFHVIDAFDFPLGVPRSFDLRDIFIINRCDLIVAHKSQLVKLKRYYMKEIFRPLGISDDQVFLVSAKREWNLKKLAETFVGAPKQNHFVGPTNAGKSRLVHALTGISEKVNGPTTWPVPFTTQQPSIYRSLPEYRLKTIVDSPSEFSKSAGARPFSLLPASLLRKVSKGVDMFKHDPKYAVPKVKAKPGQVVSIGGLVAIEFPPLPNLETSDGKRSSAVHVFVGIGGIAHTEFGQAFRDLSKIESINRSSDPNHLKMRMHKGESLELEPALQFEPFKDGERQTIVISGLGFVQPFLIGDFPPGYKATVYAPKGVDVASRTEILPYLF